MLASCSILGEREEEKSQKLNETVPALKESSLVWEDRRPHKQLGSRAESDGG